MRKGFRPLGAVVSVAAVAALAGPAAAAPPTETQPLQDAVKVGNNTSGIRQHLKKLQEIADRKGANGTRATGTQGHEDSVTYVKQQLEATGYYNVSTQPFTATVFTQLAPSTLSTTPSTSGGWVENTNFATMEFSASGSVANAGLVSIDFAEPTSTASTSSAGCEASDFPATGIAGKVALIQRGTCDFGQKVVNAQDAGAAAVIIFNEGTLGDPDRNGLINGTLGGYDIKVPTLETTDADGRMLHDAFVANANPTVSLSTSARTDLTCWFEHDLDIAAAAARLHLHPNSLRYRLAKIEERIGRSLRLPSTIADLHIALLAERVGEAPDSLGRHLDDGRPRPLERLG